MPRGEHLRPFTSATASEAGKRSAAARKAKAAEQRAAKAVIERSLTEWADTFQREDLGTRCALAAQKVAADILSGAIVVTEKNAAPILTALVDITRLEEGLHTSATMHASITMGDDPMDRIRQIRAAAQGGSVTPPLPASSNETQGGSNAKEPPPGT